MGQVLLKPAKGANQIIPKLVDETQFFTTWTLTDVKELLKRFRSQICGFALVEAQFESVMSFKEGISKQVDLEALFHVLDNDHDGRIDGLELLGGIALCCEASFEDKARFCFELYDFNLNSTMSKKEMIMMFMIGISGVNLLTGGDDESFPNVQTIEALADDAFLKADSDGSGMIGYEEFLAWARSNRDLMAAVECLHKAAHDAKVDVQPDDSAPETDEGELSDAEPGLEYGATIGSACHTPASDTHEEHMTATEAVAAAIAVKLNPGQLKVTPVGTTPTPSTQLANTASRDGSNGITSQSSTAVQWKSQIFEPTNFKHSRRDKDGPDTNLELCWAFGYRTRECSRNNLQYILAETDPDTQCVVYPTASLAVIYDIKSRSQSFYQGHSSMVTCVSVHPKGFIVATGDAASNIHIWSVNTMSSLCVIKGIVKQGIQRLAFSPSGDRIACVGLDPDHTVAIYDTTTGEIISSAKGLASPNNVYDMAYAPNGSEICIVGRKQVKFFKGVNTSKRALDSYMGRIGKNGKRQTFFCAVYFGDDVIVGCASGELYRFSQGRCVQSVQAHGLREPVLSISYNAKEGVLVTGGKDCLVKTWDFTLKEVGSPIDMSEDVDGHAPTGEASSEDKAVISVQMLRGRILIGTRGGDSFEAHLPGNPNDSHGLVRIGWSHCKGALQGLCAHPIRDEFATCGTDKTLRIWSIRSKEQVAMRKLPMSSKALAYNAMGDIIALGLEDGSVGLIETSSVTLKVYSTLRDSHQEITDVKFSPDGKLLAVSSNDCNIYIYAVNDDKKTFRRQAVCRGHSEPVTHIDFSGSSHYIRSNGNDSVLFFWDIKGNQIKVPSSLRDVVWATNTCPLSWATQGIWSESSDYTEVAASVGLEEVGVVVTATKGHVNLFRMPSVHPGSLHKSYVGHAGDVANVRASYNRRHIISLGRDDSTVLLWTHILELDEDSGDDNNSVSSQSTASSDGGMFLIDVRQEIADVGPRALLQEAVNTSQPAQVISELAKLEMAHADRIVSSSSSSGGGGSGSDGKSVIPKWRSAIAEPSSWIPTVGCTDVDLELKWVHGYRCHDCRNNIRYTAAGEVVFTAAKLAVVYSKQTGKQRFLTGAHNDDVISLASHPSGQLFATGETGRKPDIVIWDSRDMRVVSRIGGSHKRGVPLMAFNSKGHLLASIGLDDNNTLTVHDWAQGVLQLSTPTDKRKVLTMCYLANNVAAHGVQTRTGAQTVKVVGTVAASAAPAHSYADSIEDVIVTAGEKHVKFWWNMGKNVCSQKGLWGKESREVIMCVASGSPGICVTGSAKGNLLVWQHFKAVANAKKQMGDIPGEPGIEAYPHADTPIESIWAVGGEITTIHEGSEMEDLQHDLHRAARYITSDKDGSTIVWRLVYNKDGELRLKIVGVIPLGLLAPTTISKVSGKIAAVRSVCERDGSILIGTSVSEVYEVFEEEAVDAYRRFLRATSLMKDGKIERATQPINGKRLIAGHSGHGELRGLSVHPSLPVYVTCGDDGLLCCWSLKQHRLMSYLKLPEKARAVEFHPIHGKELAVALNSGHVSIVASRLLLNPDNLAHVELDAGLSGRFVAISESAITAAQNDYWASRTSQLTSYAKALEAAISPRVTVSPRAIPVPSVTGDPVTSPPPANNGVSSSTPAAPAPAPAEPKALSTENISKPSDERKAASVPPPASFIPGTIPDLRYLSPGPTMWVEVLKYSFDGSILAIGSHDFSIYLYDVKSGYKRRITDPASHFGHESFITHLDFGIMLVPSGAHERLRYDTMTRKVVQSVKKAVHNLPPVPHSSMVGLPLPPVSDNKEKDQEEWVDVSSRDVTETDICIQSACGAGEIRYWTLQGGRIDSPTLVKDVWWSSWSLPIGWPVQGIWPAGVGVFEYQINAVARSYSWEQVPVLAAADEFGVVKLFNYPCVTDGAPSKAYKGHSSNVTNVKFSSDDSFLLTTGGSDHCVFVWGTDVVEEKRAREALLAGTGMAGMSSVVMAQPPVGAGDSRQMADAAEDESFAPVRRAVLHGGDQTLSVKPWKGAVREPTDWSEPADLGEAPTESLELKFVFGYRGWDCRNNICYADSSRFSVYHIAAVGIVYDSETHSQVLNTDHDDDILCIAMHPEGHTVASGEIGVHPKIVIWDASTGVTVGTLKYHKKGVSNLAFAGGGALLVSIGMDDDRTIAVHNWKTLALIGSGKAGRGVDVYTLSVSTGAGDRFVTGGKNHIKFWDVPTTTSSGGELSSKAGIYGKAVKARTVISSSFLGVDPVTGMLDGTIVLWKDRGSTKCVQAHEGPVTAMCPVIAPTVAGSAAAAAAASASTGDSSPRIVTGGRDGFVHVWNIQLSKEWSLDLKSSVPVSVCPQIHALATREGRVLIGTKAGEIYEVNRLNPAELYRYVQGHYGDRAEVWGLAAHPTSGKFATAGDDETIRVWDTKALQQIAITSVASKVRAITFSSDGTQLAAATFDGKVLILSDDLRTKVTEVAVAKSWIQTMAFSPNNATLAVGSHDDFIYLLDTKTFSCRAKCKGHHSYITALDFSADSSRLRSTSGDYELIYWDVQTGRQVTMITEMRDVRWATTTCLFGWSQQGIWPANADGTDINSVDASPDGKLIASGDDSRRVKIFRHPCPKEHSKFREYKGHAEHVLNVKFSRDGKHLFTVGGLDKAVMMFAIK